MSLWSHLRSGLSVCAVLFVAACGSEDGEDVAAASTSEDAAAPPVFADHGITPRPTEPDPLAWSRAHVTEFDRQAVEAMRATPGLADHRTTYRLEIPGHPTLGLGGTLSSNALVAARVDFARSTGLTGAGQLVSMIDDGVRSSHEQFSGKTLFTSGSGPAQFHGTAVASVIAGTGGSGTSAGVAPGAALHSGHMALNQPIGWGTLAGYMRDARELGAVASNNSWALEGITVASTDLGTYFRAPGRVEYLRALGDFTATGVVVFAMDNDYHAISASGLAALPTAFPDLERGWLAVINVVPEFDDLRVRSATRISSACLEAARWCLAADGQLRVATAEGDASYAIGGGASFATPQVAGAIALLAEAFPTLTAGQLRDRLLATADNGFFDHTGVLDFAPGISHGYNEEFGHGFLDLRAALLPIGAHVIPMSDGGARPFGQIAVIDGGATGDAVAQALAQARVISVDGLFGSFETSAGHLGATRAPAPDLAAMLGRAMGQARAPIFDRVAVPGIDGGLVLPEFESAAGLLTLVLPEDGEAVAGLSLRRAVEAGPGLLSLAVSVAMHERSAMGLRVPSAEGRLAGRMAGMAIGYRVGVGRSGEFGVEAEFGVAAARGAGLLARVGGLRYDGLRLRYALDGVATRGDRLSLLAARPVALTAGRAQMDLPTGMSGGQPVFSRLDIGLSPSARQVDLGLEYMRPIAGQAWLRVGVMHSANVGHIGGARDLTTVAGVSARF